MVKPKKSLSQNFLIDKNISNKIINQTNVKGKYILEIGPGYGFLTDNILEKNPKKIYLIEKDHNLKKILFKKYTPKNYLTTDLLKTDKIDSMVIFKLIVTLESKYKIKISDNELFSGKFKNIENISILIEKKINAIKKK